MKEKMEHAKHKCIFGETLILIKITMPFQHLLYIIQQTEKHKKREESVTIFQYFGVH
jgi:hypothetical protein